jgi:hypothetical protein
MASMNGYALIAGIANYKYTRPLPAAVLNDVRDITTVLRDPAICAYPPDPERVRSLSNSEATRKAFLEGLEWIKRRADEDASVFIYFSGHGGRRTTGRQAGEYLIPFEGTLSETQSWRGNISGREFIGAVSAIRSRRLLVVLDCCHAAGIADGKGAADQRLDAPDFRSGLTGHFLDQLGDGRGRVVYSSSRDTEESYIAPGAANSLFTGHMLAGLRGGVASEDGFIGVLALYEYIYPRVVAQNSEQHPILKAEHVEGFPIAMYRGGTRGVIPKDDQGFRYDVFISYVDREPDATVVWDELIPRLEGAGLRVAIGGEFERGGGGVARVIGLQRALQQSKRIIVVLSRAYIEDCGAEVESAMSQELGIGKGEYRILPLYIEPIEPSERPLRFRFLSDFDMTHPRRAARLYDQLIEELHLPVPRMDAKVRTQGHA